MATQTVIATEQELIAEFTGMQDGTDVQIKYRNLVLFVHRRGRDRTCSFEHIPGIIICTESLQSQISTVRDINFLADISGHPGNGNR